MNPVITHPWNVTEAEARRIQRELAQKVELADRLPDPVRLVAGVDAAYETDGDRMFAVAVLFDADTLAPLETVEAEGVSPFPYVPGLLSFREIPILQTALAKLSQRPDLIVCDGQGIAHPNRLGLASHLGVVFDVPTIGCAKTRFVGDHAPVGNFRGDFAPLMLDGDEVGSALRTQDGVNVLYVSPGHRVSHATARDWILKLAPNFRLPETTRAADHAVNDLRRRVMTQN
jgi:deoxyribonuclease V